MKTSVIRLLAIVLLLAGLGVLVLSARKRFAIQINEQTKVETAFVHQVQIWENGEVQVVDTSDSLPANILADAGIQLKPGDQVLVNAKFTQLDVPLSWDRPLVLQIYRAVPVTLQILPNTPEGDSFQEQTILSSALTLGEALDDTGIVLRAADELSPPVDTPLNGPITVTLKRAQQIRIESNGEVYPYYVVASSVGTALAKAGISLQNLDYSIPPQDQPVPGNGRIRVIHVHEDVVQEQEPIPFTTLTQPAQDIELDTQQIIQIGQYGLKIHQVRIRYEDGIEVSRQADEEWVAVEPKPRIVGYGTQIVIRTLNTSAGPIEYWRVVEAYATSYSPCRLGRPNFCNDRTASGILLKKGVVGVIRSWYNAMAGSYVYIPDYGKAVIADIGGGVAGRNWIDLGYSDKDFVTWSRNVKIYFLTPVPPDSQILWVLP